MATVAYSNFIAIPNGTRIFNYGFDQCVALFNYYNETVVGGAFPPVQSAYQLWTNFENLPIARSYTKHLDAMVGDVFISRGGIYDAKHGHVGIVTGVTETTITTMEQNAGQWRYVGRYTRGMANIFGFLRPNNNPAGSGEPLTPMQRRTGGEPVNRRSEPTTKSAAKEPMLAANTVANLVGYVWGEEIAGDAIWFKGISGDYFWRGAFADRSTDHLPDLTPQKQPEIKPTQRVTIPIGVVMRSEPKRGAAQVGTQAGSIVCDLSGYVHGESIEGNSVWFVGAYSGAYIWSGGFTNPNPAGLPNLTANPSQPPEAPVEPSKPSKPIDPPTPPQVAPDAFLRGYYGDLWDVTGDEGIKYLAPASPEGPELPLPIAIQETFTPAHTNGYSAGRWRGEKPSHFVIHHTATSSLSGAVATLQGVTGEPTASYVVGDHRVVGMVTEDNSPWTNGRWTSNATSVTLELVNAGGVPGAWLPPSEATLETAAWLLARSYFLWEMTGELEHGRNIFGHNEVSKSATACPGDTDLPKLIARANEIISAMAGFWNTTPGVPSTPPVETPTEWITVEVPVVVEQVEPGVFKSYVRVQQPR